MWPWFSSSILGRNALVVWGGGQRRQKGKEENKVSLLVQLFCAKLLWSTTHIDFTMVIQKEWDEMGIYKRHKKRNDTFPVLWNRKKTFKLKFGWSLLVERPSSGAQQGHGCMFLCNLLFSHTDLVPTIGPGSKDLVTAPITCLCSLNDKTIKPFVWVSPLGWRWKHLATTRTRERFNRLENG